MISSYVKIAIRNLVRSKVFSLLNIVGLAVGITCFIILTLLVMDEMGFDSFHTKADRIYRIYISSDINGNASNTSKTPIPMGEMLRNEFPEVENFARIGYFGQHDVKYDGKLFREGDMYATDSTYFQLFTLPFKYGDPATALVQPRSVVLSEDAARKYFGDENPIGRQLILDDTTTFQITGVMYNYPAKSHFACNFLVSMSTYAESNSQNWIDSRVTTYILFRNTINSQEFEKKLVRVVKEKVMPQAERVLGINMQEFLTRGNRYGFYLQPLTSIYLYSQSHYGIELNTEWGNVRTSSIYYSYVFTAIGIFILLIAIFNFMNLTTAKSEGRAKEVGIRKTLGSDRTAVMWQFVVESIVTCFTAVIVACALILLVLPIFNSFVGRNLSFALLSHVYVIPLLLIFTLAVGTLAGSYPAFYLSSFQPSHILKPVSAKRKRNFRNVLVIIQFTISVVLIIGTLIVKHQLHYIMTKDLGFEQEQLIVINNASTLGRRIDTFKQELSNIPSVVSSTNSSVMFQTGIPGSSFRMENATPTEFISCQFLDVDYDFAATYKVQVSAGRYFSRAYTMDSSAVVMNETAAKIFQTGNPVGKMLYRVNSTTRGDQPFKIVGVIKDFNYESLHQAVRPLVLHISPVRQAGSILSIRIKTANVAQALQEVKETWQSFTGGRTLNCSVLHDKLERMYRNELRIETIATVFSSLAICIACLGLFGLAAYSTEKRMKEIGIRKVLGASSRELVLLLTREFTKWVLVANVIAWPIAYAVMSAWLQDFAYRIDMSIWMFLLAGGITVMIAFATVGYHTMKAAISNPVEALRNE